MSDDPFVLVIEWDQGVDLPAVVGPFHTLGEAAEWAKVNIPNGSHEVHRLTYPYSRGRASRD